MIDKNSRIVLAIFVLLSATAVGYGLTNSQTYTSGSTLKTDSGLSVTLDDTTEEPSGNPFGSSDSVTLRGIRFNSPGPGAVTLASNTTQWTNLTSINSTQNEITVVPANKPVLRFSGGIDSVRLTDDVDVSQDGRTEVIVNAPSSGQLTVDTNGNGAVAVDTETSNAIDEGTVNSDGTVTFDIPSGTHRIDLQTAPSTLFVFQEQNPSKLISGNADIRVRFFADGSEKVIERTITDGTADLSGLPSDQQFVVTVSADDTPYTYRRIVVDSLSEQQDVYLLNKSRATTVDVEFALTDYTGQYPGSETNLFIEKPITKDFDNDGSNETRYRTILGDNFGASGQFPATLAQNERYRLRIANQPNQRILGAYTAARSEVQNIRIQDLEINLDSFETWTTLVNEKTKNGSRTLTSRYIDKSTETSRLSVEIYERNNPSNVVYTDTISNAPIQNYSAYQIPVQDDTSYVVNWTITRDGKTLTQTQLVGGGALSVQIPLDSDWLGTFGFVFVAFIGSLAGARKDHIIAVVVVAIAGMMMGLKVVDISVPLWWAAVLIAVGGYIRQQQQRSV